MENTINIFNRFSKTISENKQRSIGFKTKDLFIENNPHGYISREHLIEYASGVSEYQQQKLLLFFEHLASGYPIVSLPIPNEDEYGNMILWVKFRVGTNRQIFKLYSEAWLIKLVKDYSSGKLHGFQFSADEMAEELAKVQS